MTLVSSSAKADDPVLREASVDLRGRGVLDTPPSRGMTGGVNTPPVPDTIPPAARPGRRRRGCGRRGLRRDRRRTSGEALSSTAIHLPKTPGYAGTIAPRS